MSLARSFSLVFLFIVSVAALRTPPINRELINEQTFGRRATIQVQNAQAAQALNAKFATLTMSSSCTQDEVACVGEKFAMCDNGKFVLMDCGPSLQCYALPLVNSAGTTVTCDTADDATARLDIGGSIPTETISSSIPTKTASSSSSTFTRASSTSQVVATSTSSSSAPPATTSVHRTTTTASASISSTHSSLTTSTPPATSSSVHQVTSASHTTSSASNPVSTGSIPNILNGIQSGDATWYDTGLTACGETDTDDNAIVAVSHVLFDEFPGYNKANPNTNPICGQKIKASYQGRSVIARITDRCEACLETDLDFTPALYKQLDPNGSLDSGRLHGMTWEWAA